MQFPIILVFSLRISNGCNTILQNFSEKPLFCPEFPGVSKIISSSPSVWIIYCFFRCSKNALGPICFYFSLENTLFQKGFLNNLYIKIKNLYYGNLYWTCESWQAIWAEKMQQFQRKTHKTVYCKRFTQKKKRTFAWSIIYLNEWKYFSRQFLLSLKLFDNAF